MNTEITNKLIFINGACDLIMVLLHISPGFSLWSHFNISKDFLYFASLYGFIRLLLTNNYDNNCLIKLTYYLETIYFLNNGFILASLVCLVIGIIV